MARIYDALDSALWFAQTHGVNFYHVAFVIPVVVICAYLCAACREVAR